MDFIANQHAQLAALAAELDSKLGAISDSVRREHDSLSADWMEAAQQQENDEVVDALGNSAREELRQIRHALKRIEAGSYCDCESCGDPIPEGRLKALPFTSLCTKCAEKSAPA